MSLFIQKQKKSELSNHERTFDICIDVNETSILFAMYPITYDVTLIPFHGIAAFFIFYNNKR